MKNRKISPDRRGRRRLGLRRLPPHSYTIPRDRIVYIIHLRKHTFLYTVYIRKNLFGNDTLPPSHPVSSVYSAPWIVREYVRINIYIYVFFLHVLRSICIREKRQSTDGGNMNVSRAGRWWVGGGPGNRLRRIGVPGKLETKSETLPFLTCLSCVSKLVLWEITGSRRRSGPETRRSSGGGGGGGKSARF